MKKLLKNLICIAFYLICHTVNGQFLFQINKDTCIKWNYNGGDEFNGSKIDESMWRTSFPWSRSLISEDIFYSEKNVIVDSGLVKFRVQKEKTKTKLHIWEHDSLTFKREGKYPDSTGTYELNYTGGLIWSLKKYKYGYFEVRFKNPNNIGLWPAFWLYGENANEIDFMELKGEKNNQMHVDIHCPEGCNNYIQGYFNYRKAFGHWIKTDGNFYDQFNVVSGEWQPGYVKYYLNGNLVAYFKGDINVGLDLTTGNGKAHKGGPFAPGVGDKTLFPSDFIVDYVRVWSKETNDSLQDISGSNFTVAEEKQSNIIEPKSKKIKFKRKADQSLDELITLSVLPLEKNGYIVYLSKYNKDNSKFKFEVTGKNDEKIFEPFEYSTTYFKIAVDKSNKEIYLKLKFDLKEYKYRLK